MRVALFSRFPKDVDNPCGGVETATLGLVRGLKAVGGVDVHVVTLEKDRRTVSVDEKEGTTIHRLPGTGWPMFLDVMIGPGWKRVRQYIQSLRPDIVHYQETYGLGADKLGVPTLFTVHGFDSLNLPAEKNWLWWLRSLIWRIVENIGLRKQKWIVSITPYVRKEIETRTRVRIYDIDNAISERFFNIQRREVRGKIFFSGWLNARAG